MAGNRKLQLSYPTRTLKMSRKSLSVSHRVNTPFLSLPPTPTQRQHLIQYLNSQSKGDTGTGAQKDLRFQLWLLLGVQWKEEAEAGGLLSPGAGDDPG